LGYGVWGSGKPSIRHGQHCETWQDGYTCAPEISRLWGQYSPFWPVGADSADSGSVISPSIPEGCEITFAQILSRHGARDPTLGRSIFLAALIARIHDVVPEPAYGENVTFLRDYKYTLGADELSRFGEEQLRNSGVRFYHRYRDLARKYTPFFRAADQHRVVESARFWGKGFHETRQADKRADHHLGRDGNGDEENPYPILEIPEYSPHNNTLSPDTCPAFGPSSALGHEAQRVFAGVFAPPITARLNANLPGANLSDSDTIALMDLCPYETVADRYGRPSQICDIFGVSEWESYDYFQSLGKWYGYSSGNPLGPTQGVGFANELIARLTDRAVEDHTTTNSTLDSDPETFPLGRKLYADFSHDNDMAAMFGALGLYNATKPLDKYVRQDPRGEEARGWAASWTVPFAARMYVEKMVCTSAPGRSSGSRQGGDDKELVRVLVNDRVIPLQNCGMDELGRCELGRFVESLSFVRDGGHWDRCFKS